MTIIRRIPWTRQPPKPIGIDWRNPLSKDLVIAITGSGQSQGVIINYADPANVAFWDGQADATPTNLLFSATPEGVAFEPDNVGASGADNPGITFVSNPVTGSQNRTQMWGFYRKETEVANHISNFGTIATGERLSILYFTDGNITISISGGNYISSLNPSQDVYSVLGYRLVGTTLGDMDLYLDGTFEASSGAQTINTTTTSAMILGDPFTLNAPRSTDKIVWFFMWARDLSDAEFESVRKNPWQLYSPRLQIIPIDVVVAAVDYVEPLPQRIVKHNNIYV